MLELTVIDLFSGAGGLSKGFADSGFRILYAVDTSEDALETFSANHPTTVTRNVDIRNVTKKSIEQDLGAPVDHLDVLIGGPPCQGFSWLRAGPDDDPRNDLVEEFVRLVIELKPTYFLFENVPALLTGRRGRPTMDRITVSCEKAGYEIKARTIDTSLYGVAQIRKRAFVLGGLTHGASLRFDFPKPTRSKVRTVRDAIQDLSKASEDDVPNHVHARLSELNVRRLLSLREGQGRDSLAPELRLPTQARHPDNGHNETYGRMRWDQPSPTLTTAFQRISKGKFGHPSLPRGLTLREGARLQGFTDDFVFHGKLTQIARQIGNAVPPPLAKVLADQIIHFRTVTIDVDNSSVLVASKQYKLTRCEFSVFQVLFERRRTPVSWSEIAEGYSGRSSTIHAIRLTIYRLRKKLGDNVDGPRFILTRRTGQYEMDCVAGEPGGQSRPQ